MEGLGFVYEDPPKGDASRRGDVALPARALLCGPGPGSEPGPNGGCPQPRAFNDTIVY